MENRIGRIRVGRIRIEKIKIGKIRIGRKRAGEKKSEDNFLEWLPVRAPAVIWTTDDLGGVILQVENKGFFNGVAQRFFRRPGVSYVRLDELGSAVWILSDGERSLLQLGEEIRRQFGERAEPLYQRLSCFFQILNRLQLISWR